MHEKENGERHGLTNLSQGTQLKGKAQYSTVYLLIKVACFVKKVYNVFDI